MRLPAHPNRWVIALTAATVSGCTVIGSPTSLPPTPSASTSPQDQTSSIRQTDALGRSLPFKTKFPKRWNSGNDGTTYEPCTAASRDILLRSGLVPESATDAALANFQTARGCNWHYRAPELARITQIVGNSRSLEEYKDRQSIIMSFQDDIQIAGRTVAVGGFPENNTCSTFVQSGNANVSTLVSFQVNAPLRADICAKAIEFTRATIDQMPE